MKPGGRALNTAQSEISRAPHGNRNNEKTQCQSNQTGLLDTVLHTFVVFTNRSKTSTIVEEQYVLVCLCEISDAKGSPG